MLKKILLPVLVAVLLTLLSSSPAQAWGGFHYAYHYSPYSGFHYAYRYGYGGYPSYGGYRYGYHYGFDPYDRYYGGLRYGYYGY
jgi:hypothetical protein